MKKHKLNMQLITIAALISSIILFSSASLAQENGKVYQLSYSPSEPVVFEEVQISIGVENPSDITRNYFMQVQIIKDGKIANEQEFTFTLDKSKGIFLTPEYSPQDIGKHEVIVKLYDKFRIDLYDTKIIEFNSVSHLGPFDIVLDPLTTRVRSGFKLPATVLLENFGVKGTDVEVKVSINCLDRSLSQSFTVFVPSHNRTEQLVALDVCESDGLYDVTASIILFNKTWVSSASQVFVNSSYIQLQFDVPENLTLKPGESYSFPVEVTNLGNQKINDLKFLVQRIPLSWQKTSPSSIIEVRPNEKVIFIVNITVPPDAEARSYEVRMTAAAEEVVERKISTLEVTSLAVSPGVPIAGTSLLTYIIISVSGGIILLTGGNAIVKRLKSVSKIKQPSKERLEILKKIKEKISG